MSALPFIDEHSIAIDVPVDRAWDAVRRFARERLERPAPRAFVVLWKLDPDGGFAVAEADPPRRLRMRGHHRFSRYELELFVDEAEHGALVRARTYARFPGIAGGVYRALVIGSRGHKVAMKMMLRSLARSASIH